MPPQITNAIETTLAESVLSRIANGRVDAETGSWVFSALFVAFMLFAVLLILRLMMLEKQVRKIRQDVDSSDELESVDE